MSPTLYLAPTTASALDHALARSRAAQANHPLAPTYLLLPNADAIRQARRQAGNTVGVHLLQFYRLAQTILERAGTPTRELGDAAARRLLQHLLAGLAHEGELTTFAPMLDKPGFIQALREWLNEMKSQGIPPDAVRAACANERDRQLALIYERYQPFLQAQSLSDGDGLLWLASDALAADAALLAPRPTALPGPFSVLGFDQFTPIQRRLLRQLAERLPDFALYLLWDDERPAESLALTRLRQSRDALDAEIPSLQVRSLDDSAPADPTLARLRRTLFEEPTVAPLAPADQPPAIRALAAPSRESEVRHALRAIKQRLLAGDPPDALALLAPQPAAYGPIVHAIAIEYGVPLRYEQGLLANPAIAALHALLTLAPAFPWRETFDALRSPYLCQRWLDAEQLDLLDRLTRERPVVSGWRQWRDALQPLARPTDAGDAEPDTFGPPPLAARTPRHELLALEQGLHAFFDHLAPPESATHRAYTLWVQEAILGLFPEAESGEAGPPRPTLDMLACCQRGEASDERDLQALAHLLHALRALVESVTLLPLEGDGRVTWSQYRSDLFGLLASLSLPSVGNRAAVRFGPLDAGRAVTVDHLFLLGLSEGEFPRRPEPDLFYTPADRAAQRLPLRQPDPAEDASLWWQVLSNCRATLTLLRPRLDEGGTPWLPSPYWEATLAQVSGLAARVEEPPIDESPSLARAASRAELLVALVSAGAAVVPDPLREPWEAAHAAHEVMRQRQSRLQPPDIFEGVLQDPILKAELAARYGADHVWSASRLNHYARCPYGFFAEHVLDLAPRADPAEGLNARQRGSLLHALLEHLHHCLTDADLALTPENRAAVLEQLDGCCLRLFAAAPAQHGFRPSPLWEQEQEEMRRLVRALVEWECSAEREGSFRPFRQEVGFGLAHDGLPRLTLPAADGTTFQLHGVIDRIDRDEAGRVRVVDYKSGSAPFAENAVAEGLALQTALYALAAEQLLPGSLAVVESYYLHIPARKRSGVLHFTSPVADHATVAAALERAAAFVEGVRAGRFPSAPGSPASGSRACSDGCDFAALCRVTRQSIWKGRAWE